MNPHSLGIASVSGQPERIDDVVDRIVARRGQMDDGRWRIEVLDPNLHKPIVESPTDIFIASCPVAGTNAPVGVTVWVCPRVPPPGEARAAHKEGSAALVLHSATGTSVPVAVVLPIDHPGVAMESDLAELSTVSTQVEDLIERVTTVAERHRGTDRDDVAIRLFEVERALHNARRGLQSAARSMR